MKKAIHNYKGKTGLVETLTDTATFKIHVAQEPPKEKGFVYDHFRRGFERIRKFTSVGRAMQTIRSDFKHYWDGDLSTVTVVIYPKIHRGVFEHYQVAIKREEEKTEEVKTQEVKTTEWSEPNKIPANAWHWGMPSRSPLPRK